MIIIYAILLVLFLFFTVTATEIFLLIRKKTAQELPLPEEADSFSTSINGKKIEELYSFLCGDKNAPVFSTDEAEELIKKQCNYMLRRFDCADFRAQLLFKIYKDCYDVLSEKTKAMIKSTFLGFKYFMDEPGTDSMCYWSENHQILFAVSEYLAGQEWKEAIFTNNNMTGEMHRKKAEERILAWMEQRFYYGFSEYLSNNYLAEDIAPMGNFIAYCKDEELVNKMKIIMDLLWLDVAQNSVNNRFVAVSSRMYGNNKISNIYGNSIQTAMNCLWGGKASELLNNEEALSPSEKELSEISLSKAPNHITVCFTDIVKKGLYTLPPVIKEIAFYNDGFVSKTGCGLSPSDLEKEKLIGQKPYQIMAQMGAEAFTNPQVINNTLKYLKSNKMFGNSFVSNFKFLTVSAARLINLRWLTEKFDMLPHGIVLGRGNIYTYRTPYYSLSTDICKDIDRCGAQDHQWSANISEELSLFTTHPAGDGNSRFGASPGYWIGNGRRPMSVQYESVNITIYKIPHKKRFGETAVSDITHAFMPKKLYDETQLHGNIVFARKNNVYIAIISNGELYFRPFNKNSADGIQKGYNFLEKCNITDEFDLVRQGGAFHAYITELSDISKESYDEFKARIRKNRYDFSDGSAVTYSSYFGEITAVYKKGYSVCGTPQKTEFDRFENIFCTAERKAERITVKSKSNSLELCYKDNKRIIS